MDYTENDDLIWVEKFRPRKVEDCILPDRLKNQFKSFVGKKTFPNLLLCGGPGTGKTTIARALCEELQYDYILINASDERNIDVVRGRIRDFASTVSLTGGKKAIILDEADGLAALAQSALRAAIEEFSDVRFILTCNYKNRLIPALHSRTMVIEFSIKAEEKLQVQTLLLKRVLDILTQEEIDHEPKAVAALVKSYFPDNRKILNTLNGYAKNGKIDAGILTTLRSANIMPLVLALKDSNVGLVKQWVVDNADLDTNVIFRALYDTLYTELNPNAVPQIILIIAQYQHYAVTAADQEINTMACLMEILSAAQWK